MNGRVQANGPGTGPRETDIDLVETRAAIQGDSKTNVTGVTTMGGCSMGLDKMAGSNRVWVSKQKQTES